MNLPESSAPPGTSRMRRCSSSQTQDTPVVRLVGREPMLVVLRVLFFFKRRLVQLGHDAQKRVHDFRIKMCPDLFLDVSHDFFSRPARPVRPIGNESVVHISYGENAGMQADRLARQAKWIAR